MTFGTYSHISVSPYLCMEYIEHNNVSYLQLEILYCIEYPAYTPIPTTHQHSEHDIWKKVTPLEGILWLHVM